MDQSNLWLDEEEQEPDPKPSSESTIIVHDESEIGLDSPGELLPSDLPESIPILPLRGVVVYPETALPLTIGQPRSIRMVDDVAGADQYIGLVASRKPELELPGPEDLFPFGTLATIQRLIRAPDGTIRMIVQG